MISRHNGSLVVYACVLACVVFVVAMVAQPGHNKVPPPSATEPMVLMSVNIPPVSLPAPSGTYPSNGSFQLTSSSGPFCIVSLRPSVGMGQTVQNQVGDVDIALQYQDGVGVSLPWWKLYDGQTTGYSLLDLSLVQSTEIMWHGNPALVSQGGQVCVNQSVQYAVEAWPSSTTGAGLPVTVSGRAMVLTQPSNTVTATVN